MSVTLRALFPQHADRMPDIPVSGFAIDSRDVVPGSVFVALRGLKAHGLQFAPQAVAKGAACILIEGPLPEHGDPARQSMVTDEAESVPCIVLDTLRADLGAALVQWHGGRSAYPRIIGVTGTNGKTSTVQLLAASLDRLGVRAGTIGTLGAGLVGALEAGERTTPDVIATHRLLTRLSADGAQTVAMEVSSHALEQQRVAGLQFEHAAFSNLTRDHLDYHGDMAAYGEAKARLFRWPGLKTAVINIDDDFGAALVRQVPEGVRIIRVSSVARGDTQVAGTEYAELRADEVVVDGHGLGFRLTAGTTQVVIQTRLLGRFNVDNLLLVAGLLVADGVALPTIAEVFSTLEPVPGRMNRVDVRDPQALVVVDYAHTPDGLEKALVTLRGHCAGQLIVVFGCGGDRDPGKRPQMGALAASLADQVIVTDDNPRTENGDSIVAMIVAGAHSARSLKVERDRRLAIRMAIAAARPGDVVLIAGKGHEPDQEINGIKLPFDDRREAESALREAA